MITLNTDLDVLFDFESALESNIKSSLAAADFSAFTRLDVYESFQKVTPRVEVQMPTIGATNGHYGLCPLDSSARLDQFAFSIALQLVTIPKAVAAENTAHPLSRARLRNFLSTLDVNSRLDTANWPRHCLSNFRDAGTEPSLETEDGFEFSVLRYDGIIGIRSTAWPTE